MRILFSFLLFVFSFGLEINVDYAKNYEILTLYNTFPFHCMRLQKEVVCEFDKTPSTPVFKADTIYFSINPIFKKKFFLDIKVKKPFVLKSLGDNLYNAPLIGKKIKKSRKWVILVGVSLKEDNKGLNFYYRNSPKLYVGTIDENGNPININQEAADVVKYFELQKFFLQGKDILDDLDSFLKKYSHSVFIPDVLFMKLKLLDKKNMPDNVIKLGKEWIKKYSFNENLPKVLLLIAKNYTKLGFLTDASYFYQRIIIEYPKSDEAYLAMIYWADQLYMTGESKKALILYKRALYSTKNMEVASLAAMRLAQRYMDKGDIKTAIEYYKKVYEANKDFVLRDKLKAFDLAKNLASHKMYSFAIDIGSDLLKRLKKLDDLYEPLEYYLALWAYEDKNYKLSAYYINEYLKNFPYGDYSDKIGDLRDKVLFEVPDDNVTAQLQKIDEVIEKYKGLPIAKKALYKKVMLLYKLKKYKEILSLKDEILKLDEFKDGKFLEKVAKEYVKELLKKKKCFKIVKLLKEYKIKLEKKYDDEIYKCAMKTKNYSLASIVCNKYLTSPDDKVFIKWMKRKIDALWGMGDYEDVITGVDDLCEAAKECLEYKLKKFFALWKLKRFKEALKVAYELDKYDDIRVSDVFIKVVNYALSHNNPLLAAQYAKKIIYLQNKYHTYVYSPFVEFTYAQYTKNKKEAIKVLKSLLKRVKGEDKARAYYMLASLSENKDYLKKCIEIKGSKLWRGLCEDALNLF